MRASLYGVKTLVIVRDLALILVSLLLSAALLLGMMTLLRVGSALGGSGTPASNSVVPDPLAPHPELDCAGELPC